MIHFFSRSLVDIYDFKDDVMIFFYRRDLLMTRSTEKKKLNLPVTRSTKKRGYIYQEKKLDLDIICVNGGLV